MLSLATKAHYCEATHYTRLHTQLHSFDFYSVLVN